MATDLSPHLIHLLDIRLELPYRILIHNDDVTPFDFVIAVLKSVFKLSSELAEHITLTAHIAGIALVMVRPKTEADQLVARAHVAARLEGYPLTFTVEMEE